MWRYYVLVILVTCIPVFLFTPLFQWSKFLNNNR